LGEVVASHNRADAEAMLMKAAQDLVPQCALFKPPKGQR
jgi:hypothetical protein